MVADGDGPAREPVLLVLGEPTFFDARGLRPYLTGLGWPHRDRSVDQISISHVLEYLDGPARVIFMNELWRVLVPGGTASLHLPYWTSPNAVADPFLGWPPLVEESLYYLVDAGFRARNRLGYEGLKADFEVRFGTSFDPEWQNRNDRMRSFAARHYNRIVTELVCNLTKRSNSNSASTNALQ